MEPYPSPRASDLPIALGSTQQIPNAKHSTREPHEPLPRHIDPQRRCLVEKSLSDHPLMSHSLPLQRGVCWISPLFGSFSKLSLPPLSSSRLASQFHTYISIVESVRRPSGHFVAARLSSCSNTYARGTPGPQNRQRRESLRVHDPSRSPRPAVCAGRM